MNVLISGKFDEQNNVGMIHLRQGRSVRTSRVGDVILDYDSTGQLLSIELLDVCGIRCADDSEMCIGRDLWE